MLCAGNGAQEVSKKLRRRLGPLGGAGRGRSIEALSRKVVCAGYHSPYPTPQGRVRYFDGSFRHPIP